MAIQYRRRPRRCGNGVLALVAGAFATALLWGVPASAHSWYPRECCGQQDCEPVEGATLVPSAGGASQLVVSTKHGQISIPADIRVRPSEDGRMHVCMGYDAFGARDVLCFFMPSIM